MPDRADFERRLAEQARRDAADIFGRLNPIPVGETSEIEPDEIDQRVARLVRDVRDLAPCSDTDVLLLAILREMRKGRAG